MRLTNRGLTVAVVALLAGCEGSLATSPTVAPMPSPEPTPTYSYPDLPGRIEETIAEADCEHLDTLATFMDRDEVDPIVRFQAMEAITHRSEEIGC
jgi:hypothetical protein